MCMVGFVIILPVVTDENGLFDAGHDLTLIEMIDRRVGLSLS